LILNFELGLDPDMIPCIAGLNIAQSFAPLYEYFFIRRHDTYTLPASTFRYLKDSIKPLSDELRKKPSIRKIAVIGYSAELISIISDGLSVSEKIHGKNMSEFFTQRELNMMKARHILQDSTYLFTDLEQIASMVGLSKFHFIREFRSVFGVPPERYRICIRLQRAGKWLSQSTLPIAEIARKSGYQSVSAFSKAFSRFYDIPPLAYRELFST
jgi:AraC-like DNA-binding protein